MIQTILISVLLFCIGIVTDVSCQTSVSQRTAELVSQLDKTKYKKKDKGSVQMELYVDIRNTPNRRLVAEYSGTYTFESTGYYRYDIQVTANGTVTGSGYDLVGFNGDRLKFTLRDAKVEGPLLTGTKVFENGTSGTLEAAFVIRTVRTGHSEEDAAITSTQTGMGFIQKMNTMNSRVFLEKVK